MRHGAAMPGDRGRRGRTLPNHRSGLERLRHRAPECVQELDFQACIESTRVIKCVRGVKLNSGDVFNRVFMRVSIADVYSNHPKPIGSSHQQWSTTSASEKIAIMNNHLRPIMMPLLKPRIPSLVVGFTVVRDPHHSYTAHE